MARRVGVLGGTFDPVHCGHLRVAMELLDALQLDELRLIPSARPPHRAGPVATVRERLRMLQLAVAGEPRLRVDDCECRRPGASYTVDTLAHLRRELGDGVSLCFVVGADAFLTMPSWHEWRQLPRLGHLVVVARPGWTMPSDLGLMEAWRDRFTDNSDTLADEGAGNVFFASIEPLNISATRVRHLVAEGRSPRYLVADDVWTYIRKQELYGFPGRGVLPKL